ncbi:Asp-tRNA(Asn)/Glu-tRNA(Gln) amidotransferase subunit GatB [Candidatus Saccharibacteria bacterium]|nr:Asp-tRNA(Asn)/Glu-tRNA(Gln) amidotransferase subunit GatB [Candidatus Saccharibacteria bacterium]
MLSPEIIEKYEMTIGIECHVQLATKTKLFSGADNDARDAEPNTKVSPIDWALPGMLPVLNERAVKLAVRLGLAMDSEINLVSRFDRKHYFYPDLPSGYQRTQMYHPIIGAGSIEVRDENGEPIKVRIEHAHLEEDAGKQTHFNDYSLVDLNRAGTPLVEVVSMPDIHSAIVARNFCQELWRLATFSGASFGDLYHGNIRFDINISAAPKGSSKLGTRVEIKNLNSFKSIEATAHYEFARHIELIESGKGGEIIQETRGWDDAKQKTLSQRSKAEAADYRYMPDPNVPPLVLSKNFVDSIKESMPIMPSQYRRLWDKLSLDSGVVETLLNDANKAKILTATLTESNVEIAKTVANWLSGILSADENANLDLSKVSIESLSELAKMVLNHELNSTAGKTILLELWKTEDSPRKIAEELNLLQVNDDSALETIVDEVLSMPAATQAISDIKNGELKAIGFLVGQVMKKSAGKANPAKVQEIIKSKLQ